MPISQGLLQLLQEGSLLSRSPVEPNWLEIDASVLPMEPGTIHHSAWQSGPVCVISSLDYAVYPSGVGAGPQWHCSAAYRGHERRVSLLELLRVRVAFDMVDAEEDNHHPGVARHLFLPCDPAHRVACECKETEVTIVDADGFQWTNPTDGPCRGCELQELVPRVQCPLHRKARYGT